MPETTKRSISLPIALDSRLSREANASSLIAQLLTEHFGRIDAWANGQQRHEVVSNYDGKTYRFTAKFVTEDPWIGRIYVQESGAMIVVDTDDQVLQVPAHEIEEWFEDDPGRGFRPEFLDPEVYETFGIRQIVDLDA